MKLLRRRKTTTTKEKMPALKKMPAVKIWKIPIWRNRKIWRNRMKDRQVKPALKPPPISTGLMPPWAPATTLRTIR